jgi:hypothetical protein
MGGGHEEPPLESISGPEIDFYNEPPAAPVVPPASASKQTKRPREVAPIPVFDKVDGWDEVKAVWERYHGLVTPNVHEPMLKALRKYGKEYVAGAVWVAATKRNRRQNWIYCERIIYSWENNGYDGPAFSEIERDMGWIRPSGSVAKTGRRGGADDRRGSGTHHHEPLGQILGDDDDISGWELREMPDGDTE